MMGPRENVSMNLIKLLISLLIEDNGVHEDMV